MSSDPTLLADLIRAGVPADLVARVAAVQAHAALDQKAVEERKTKQRERTRRHREVRPSLNEWMALSRQVYERDGSVCHYCGTKDGPFQIDHVVPVSRGGNHGLSNLVVACQWCNCSKGDKLLNEWGGWKGRRHE